MSLLSGLQRLLGDINLPGKGIEYLANKTAGTHMVNPGPGAVNNGFYNQFRPQPHLPVPQLAQYAQPGRPIPAPPQLSTPSRVIPGSRQFMIFNNSSAMNPILHGSMQPFGVGPEDAYTATQATQPTGYSNQTSLNGNLLQGPNAIQRLLGY